VEREAPREQPSFRRLGVGRPRAEKTTISEALHDAFQKLRDAREHLGKLETLIRAKDD
jgi:hypothetical protein